RPGLEVTAAQFDPRLLCMTLEQPRSYARREIVTKRNLTDLHETGVLHPDVNALCEIAEHLVRPRRISECPTADEVVVGEVDSQATLSPIHERREMERSEVEVVAEAHLVIRCRVTDKSQNSIRRG